jgi:hypothetical protein
MHGLKLISKSKHQLKPILWGVSALRIEDYFQQVREIIDSFPLILLTAIYSTRG